MAIIVPAPFAASASSSRDATERAAASSVLSAFSPVFSASVPFPGGTTATAGDLIASSKAERRVVLVWAQKHVGGKLTNRSFRKTTSNWNPVTFTSLNPIDPKTLEKTLKKSA